MSDDDDELIVRASAVPKRARGAVVPWETRPPSAREALPVPNLAMDLAQMQLTSMRRAH